MFSPYSYTHLVFDIFILELKSLTIPNVFIALLMCLNNTCSIARHGFFQMAYLFRLSYVADILLFIISWKQRMVLFMYLDVGLIP